MKLSNEHIASAKNKVKCYLESRRETIENFETLDNGSELTELYNLGFSEANLSGNTLSWNMTTDRLDNLINNASHNHLARELLSNYAKLNPEDDRLKNSTVIQILSSPPPKKKKGRSKETMRDYFLLCALALLIEEGLSKPKSQTASPNTNSANVLDDVLKEMKIKGAYLGAESLIKIWKKRNEIAKDAINAARILQGN